MIEKNLIINFEIRNQTVAYPIENAEHRNKERVRQHSLLQCYINCIDENTHNRPFVQIIYDDIVYEISIDDIVEVVKPIRCRSHIRRLLVCAVLMNLRICREKWNLVASNYRFNKEELEYYRTIYKNGIGTIKYKK